MFYFIKINNINIIIKIIFDELMIEFYFIKIIVVSVKMIYYSKSTVIINIL